MSFKREKTFQNRAKKTAKTCALLFANIRILATRIDYGKQSHRRYIK
jgi:hypothetical protein